MKSADRNIERENPIALVPKSIPEEVTEADEAIFFNIVSEDLNDAQRDRIVTPAQIHPRQETVLAVHWHPEFVPMALIRRRIATVFPKMKESLIIPTQHNEITDCNGYAGVEVDCYSAGFNQKVQLLLHFEADRVENAGVLREMLAHTFKYRSSQLFEFIHAIIRPNDEWLSEAASETGANEALIRFVQTYVRKINALLERHGGDIPQRSIKNKVLRNFFNSLRPEYGDTLIDRVQTFLTAVKRIVKRHFPLSFFYRTREIIEEARLHNAGIVIPHPEQFWPVLLADYDVDGVEVWNPQSHRYTQFLISVLNEKNRRRSASRRPLLIFMGDDTHMGEKTLDPAVQNPEKAAREIGVQPAWDDMSVRKTLIKAGIDRDKVISVYKARLAG